MEQSALTVNKSDMPREARKTNESTFDRIWNYYHSKSSILLKDKENEIRERWEKAWYILTEHRNRKETVELIQRLFHIEKWQAYDDVKNAQLLFGDPGPQFKEAQRAMVETFILKAMKKAFKSGNMDAYEKLIGRYMKNAGLEVDDDSAMENKLKAIRATTFFFTADEELKEKAKNLMSNIPAEDVDFESVP